MWARLLSKWVMEKVIIISYLQGMIEKEFYSFIRSQNIRDFFPKIK